MKLSSQISVILYWQWDGVFGLYSTYKYKYTLTTNRLWCQQWNKVLVFTNNLFHHSSLKVKTGFWFKEIPGGFIPCFAPHAINYKDINKLAAQSHPLSRWYKQTLTPCYETLLSGAILKQRETSFMLQWSSRGRK